MKNNLNYFEQFKVSINEKNNPIIKHPKALAINVPQGIKIVLNDIDKRYLKDAPIKAPNPIKIKFIGLFKNNYYQRFKASSSDFLESTHDDLPST